MTRLERLSSVRCPAFFLAMALGIAIGFGDRAAVAEETSGAAAVTEIIGGGMVASPVTSRGRFTVLALDNDLRVAVPDNRTRPVVEPDQVATYRRRSESVSSSAEDQIELARWCRTAGELKRLKDEYALHHYRQALRDDPDNEVARAATGYSRQKGGWIPRETLMARRGMVRHGGAWKMPEAALIEDRDEAAEEVARNHSVELKRALTALRRGGRRSDSARETLRSIDDPSAVTAVAELFSDRETPVPRELRLLWIEKLRDWGGGPAAAAIVRAALDDPDSVVRDASLRVLTDWPFGRSSARATYTPMLAAKDPAIINRAARALSYFPDPESALRYTDAVVTEHVSVQAPGAGLNLGFGSRGGSGFSTGGKAKRVVKRSQNPGVVTLLRAIAPEVNFGYDEDAWRNYFAAKLNTGPDDLRRDR